VGSVHKILKIFTQTKLGDKSVDYKLNPIDIIKLAEKQDNLHRFRKDIFFCCYKTVFEEKPAILLLFTMRLPGPPTGSSASSEIVMEIVRILEKLFMPLEDMEFTRDIEEPKKNIAVIKAVKVIRESDTI
jgi:hypothetical protein